MFQITCEIVICRAMAGWMGGRVGGGMPSHVKHFDPDLV